MSKIRALRVVNAVLAIAVLNQAITGLGSDLLSHDVFEILHIGGGISLLVLALIHVSLNWGWIRLNYRKKRTD